MKKEEIFVLTCNAYDKDKQNGNIDELTCSTEKLNALGHLIYLQCVEQYNKFDTKEQTAND